MDGLGIVAGADGCHAGWICLTLDQPSGELGAALHSTAQALLFQQPEPLMLAIDMPIGLPERGPRACDREARKHLGRPRAASVFPAPIRPALVAATRDQASALTERADGRKVGVQSWAIAPKIRAVDALMTPTLQLRVREVHPEVSFAAWNGHNAMRHNKKRRAGREERLRLVGSTFGARAFKRIRERFRRVDVASDDIIDAFAALWTARRIHVGDAYTLPAAPPNDSHGLSMEIVV